MQVKADQFGDALRITIESENWKTAVTIDGKYLDEKTLHAFSVQNNMHLEAWYRSADELFSDCTFLDKNLERFVRGYVVGMANLVNAKERLPLWLQAEQRAKIIVPYKDNDVLVFDAEPGIKVDLDGGRGEFMVSWSNAQDDKVLDWYNEIASKPGGFKARLLHPDGTKYGYFEHAFPRWISNERQALIGHFGFNRTRKEEGDGEV